MLDRRPPGRSYVSSTQGSLDVSAEAARRSTNTASALKVLDTALAGSGWTVDDVYRDSVRLDPPLGYWAVYRVRAKRASSGKPADTRPLTLVGRVCFDTQDWAEYRDWLRDLYADEPCRPMEGHGFPIVVDDEQLAWWFFPIDPHLQTLTAAIDPRMVRPLLAPRYSPKTKPARIQVAMIRYHPETSAVLRYTVVDRPRAAPQEFYGKLYRDGRGQDLYDLSCQLWALSQAQPALLSVAEPVAYDDELELHIERAARGEGIGGDRTTPRFQAAARAAAQALVAMHESSLDVEHDLPLEPELDRLDGVAAQMRAAHPSGGELLAQIVSRVRDLSDVLPPETVAVTHGDMKYDQFVESDGLFTLVDFEEVGRAETSWDLGKWCAHCMPSAPRSDSDTEAAETARHAFLSRYRELRPDTPLPRLPLYEATHLGNRAMTLMQAQGSHWRPSVDRLLAIAQARLNEPAG